jgi:hypothetical protein
MDYGYRVWALYPPDDFAVLSGNLDGRRQKGCGYLFSSWYFKAVCGSP